MRLFACLALGLVPLFGSNQFQPNPQHDDPTLPSLIQQALSHDPELTSSLALVDAEKERIPQAKALPDPSLTLGLQNDGFKKLQIGMMESSYYQAMLTQPLPWPGKRALRGELASLGAESAHWKAVRTRLSLIAEVRRAYVGLLLVRGQRELLDQQTLFWQKAGEITKTRYEVGQGSQADLLRAQLELNRLRQRQSALQVEERVFLAALNRRRGEPPQTPIPTVIKLEGLPTEPNAPAPWVERAEKESPELQAARLGLRQAERSLDLAKRERFPDFAVSAGLMPRGSLDPMWSVGVSISLPVWSRQKQQRAVSEQEFRRRAQGSESENLRNLLVQRIQERTAQMEAAQDSLNIFREGLLVQSEASFQANLAQYEAGRGSFLGLLEALNGWIADRGSYLQALAQAHAISIAQEEFNLAGTPPIFAQGLNSNAMGMGSSPREGSTSSKSGATPSESGPAMTSM